MFRRSLTLLVCCLFFAGCHDSADHYHTTRLGLAEAGPWEPPADTVAMADAYDIDYTGAGPWVGTSGCSNSFTPGGQQLKDWILANWPQVTQIGGYSCRPIAGTNTMSVHGTGRAIDIHIPLDGGGADNGLGDPLANWLIEHADEIGIQMIIWDRWLWSPSREPRSRSYGGEHPHHDHLHVELTVEGANMQTPWFQGAMGAPQSEPCGEVPQAGRVIDQTDDCFVAFGPSQYWRLENSGMNGTLLWTNAFQASSPSNWARWNLNIESAGEYVVEYYNVPQYALFDSVHYRVRASGTESDIYLDQSADDAGWQEIGTFTFAAGTNQWLSVYDNTNASVASDQHIIVDALRVRPVGSEPPEEDVDNPGPTGTDTTGTDTTGTDTTGSNTDDTTPTGPTYGTDYDETAPPKGSEPLEDDTHDHDPELYAFDDDSLVHGRGHACSTAGSSPAPTGGLWLVMLGFLVGWRRR